MTSTRQVESHDTGTQFDVDLRLARALPLGRGEGRGPARRAPRRPRHKLATTEESAMGKTKDVGHEDKRRKSKQPGKPKQAAHPERQRPDEEDELKNRRYTMHDGERSDEEAIGRPVQLDRKAER